MWSAPSTDAQRAYFSTHAPKRKVFGIGQVALQIAHIALGFAAWAALYGWAFRGFPAMQPFVPLLAVGSLFTLHVLWATTWATYWYDRLDGRTETDSSWVLPIAFVAVLVFTDKEGATMFFKAQVSPPQTTNTATLDEQFQSKIAAMEAAYERDRARLEEVWQAKARAAAAPHQRNIEGWQRKRATSEADRKFIAGNVAAFTRQRDAAVAKANEGKAEALHQLYSNHEQRKADAESRHLSLLDRADEGNTAEFTRYQSDLSAADRWAWLISLFLVGAAAALSYARVRINVRSGILPERTYSTLDQHGSVLEKFWIALADGFSRQMHRASVALHRALSPNESLVDFDGNVVIAAGDYNSNPPELRPGAEARPTPPSDGERLMRDRFAAAWAQYCETGDERDRGEAGGERSELYAIHGVVGIGKEDGSVFFQRTTVPDGQLNRLYPLPRVGAPKAALEAVPVREYPAVILASGDDEPENQSAAPLPVPVTQPPQVVTQTNEVSASETLERSVKLHIQDLKREPSNLARSDARAATVHTRICAKLAALETLLRRSGQSAHITPKTAADSSAYLLTLRDRLTEAGYNLPMTDALRLLAEKTAPAEKEGSHDRT